MADNPDTTETFLADIAKAIPDVSAQSHVYKLVDNYLKQNVDGLKGKNADLIAENKKLKAKSTLPDGLDSESIKTMLDELKGKSLEDYGNSIREETANKVNDLSSKLTEAETRAQTLDRQYQSTLINLELRAAAEKAGIRPDAIDDFVAIHGKNFQLNEGNAVAGEQSTSEYVSGVLEKSEYWYPPSQGAGARGSRAGHNGLGRGDDFALNAAAQAGDMATYRKIREKQKEAN